MSEDAKKMERLLQQQEEHKKEFDGLTLEKVEQLKRSKLQFKGTHDWLKSRFYLVFIPSHAKTVKKRYLFFPEDIKRQLEIKNIFQNFDRDASNALDAQEMFEMFQDNGFPITEEDLKEFFSIVDEDKDNALNWQEFKKTAFNEKAGQVFTSFMRRIRAEKEKEPPQQLDGQGDIAEPEGEQEHPEFLPMSFNSMISYLSFCTSRKELQQFIDDDKATPFEKFKKFQEIFSLTNQYSKIRYKNSSHHSHEQPEVIQEQNHEDSIAEEKKFVQQTSKILRGEIKKLESVTTSDKKLPLTSYSELRRRKRTPNASNSSLTIRKDSLASLPKHLRDLENKFNQPQFFKNNSQSRIVRKQEKIEELKKQVMNYVDVAKQKYHIEIFNPYIGTDLTKGLQLRTTNFDSDIKDSVTSGSFNIAPFGHHNSLPGQLPKIEESVQEELSKRNQRHRVYKAFRNTPPKNQGYLDQSNQDAQTQADSMIPRDILHKLRVHKLASPSLTQNRRKSNMIRTQSEVDLMYIDQLFKQTRQSGSSAQKLNFSSLQRTESQQGHKIFHGSAINFHRPFLKTAQAKEFRQSRLEDSVPLLGVSLQRK